MRFYACVFFLCCLLPRREGALRMDSFFGEKTKGKTNGRIFLLMCIISAVSFLLGNAFFLLPNFSFNSIECFLPMSEAFFTPRTGCFFEKLKQFSILCLAELKYIFLIFISGFTSSSPFLTFAIVFFRAFAAGFASAGFLSFSDAFPEGVRFYYIIFTLFSALNSVNISYMASLSCLFSASPYKKGGIKDIFLSKIWLSYALHALTPSGIVIVLLFLKEITLLGI